MRLSAAFRLGPRPRLALTGAGGKSAALFHLGRELLKQTGKTVCLSATTHLAVAQTGLADRHFELSAGTPLPDKNLLLPPGLVLFTGPPTQDNRTAGLSPSLMDWLYELADEHDLPLLVEADGSRQKPLKAPAPHEPVVPEWVDTAVVVAGLSGLGKPLSEEWVHRPERFAGLSGVEPGETLTIEHLTRVLTSPEGGMKGIPAPARRIALLNQAASAELQGTALRVAQRLLPYYQAVVVADLPHASPSATGMQPGRVLAVHERVAGVILAAGGATRFGQVKQTLRWRGKPLVRHVAETALKAGLDPLIVVTGSAADEVRQALDGLPLVFIHNLEWESGQASSVAAGTAAVPPDAGAAIFLLADQPRLSPGLLRGLVETHAAGLPPIVAPLIDGQRANPVLFDRQTFDALRQLSGDVGGRALFSRFPPAWLAWHDASVLLDVDTPQDFERLLDTDAWEDPG